MAGDPLASPRGAATATLLALCVFSIGCYAATPYRPAGPTIAGLPAPRELAKTTMPMYRIEPPDILMIDAVNVVPRDPYTLHTLDILAINARGTLPDSPISGNYPIELGGYVNLGLPYGRVKLVKLTLEEAAEAIKKQLYPAFLANEPEVSVTLTEAAGKQQIAGEHLVGPDGTITLGTYGSVKLVGRTLEEAKEIIEAHLSKTLEDPEVAVSVYAYNSKSYYVVTEGAGLGDRVARYPITGNETVLDAISQIQGLQQVSSKKIWVARPAHSGEGCDQIMPVDWCAITQRGIVDSNYQLLPGDRVFVAEDKLIAMDTRIGKVISPIERLFGVTALGNSTIRGFRNNQNNGNNN